VKETYSGGSFGGFDGGDMEQMDPGRGIYTPSDERSVGDGDVGGTEPDRSPPRYDDDDYGFGGNDGFVGSDGFVGNDEDEYGNEDIPMNDYEDDYEESEGNPHPVGATPMSPPAARGYVDEQDFNDDFVEANDDADQRVQNNGYAAVRDPSDSGSSEVDNVSSQVQSDASNSGTPGKGGPEEVMAQEEVGTDFGDEFSDFEPE
jgi:hypothetical protein